MGAVVTAPVCYMLPSLAANSNLCHPKLFEINDSIMPASVQIPIYPGDAAPAMPEDDIPF